MKMGIVFMLLTAIIQAFIAAIVKKTAYNNVEIYYQMLFYYSIPLIAFFVFYAKKLMFLVRSKCAWVHFARGTASTISVFCFFYAIKNVPLGISATLFNTIPLFAPLMASIILKEKIFVNLYLGLLIALFGVILILDPNVNAFSMLSIIIGLCSAIFMALATVLLRYLIREKEPISRVVFYQYLSCTLVSLIILFLSKVTNVSGNRLSLVTYSNVTHIMVMLVVLGILSGLCQLTLSKASQYLTVTQLTPLFYVSVPISSFVGWIFFDQNLSFLMILGSLLVFIGICICIKRNKSIIRLIFNKAVDVNIANT